MTARFPRQDFALQEMTKEFCLMREQNATHSDLYSGLIRLHILHHACEGEIFGLWMIEELATHGYKLSPGTIYPILHLLEGRGFLVSKEKLVSGRYRKLYKATPAGRRAMLSAKEKVRQLFGELFEDSQRNHRRKRA